MTCRKIKVSAAAMMFAVMGFVVGAWAAAPTITDINMPSDVNAGYLYRGYIEAAPAPTDYDNRYITWEVDDGIPPWLDYSYINSGGAFNINTIRFFGQSYPTGDYSFTVVAVNQNTGERSAATHVNITVVPSPPIIYGDDIPEVFYIETGVYFRWDVSAQNSFGMEWSSDDLPSGLELKGYYTWMEGNGQGDAGISGYLYEVGEYTFTVKAENIYGVATKTVTVHVTPQRPPSLYVKDLPDGVVGEQYNIYGRVNIATGSSIRMNVVSGNFPKGLRFEEGGDNNAPEIYIAGIPEEGGTFNFTLEAENDAGVSGQGAFTEACEMVC